MATAGILNGHNYRVALGDETTNTPITKAFTGSLNVTSETIETSHKDTAGGLTGWKSNDYGAKSWTMNCEAYMSEDDTSWKTLLADLKAATKVNVIATTDVTGDSYEKGSALVTDVSSTFENNQPVTISFTLVGDGALTTGTISA